MPLLPGSPKIHYAIHGDSGESLLLIHGLGSSLEDWSKQIRVFAKHFQVIALDLRGCGQSDKPRGPYNIAVMADDVLRLMQHLQLQQAHVMGISLGAWIGLQLAASYPKKVSSLTAVNCGPDVKPHNLKQYGELILRLLLFRLLSMKKIGTILSKRLYPKPEQEALRQVFIQRWSNNDKKAYIATFQGILGWSIENQLNRIDCPVHLIASQFDYTDIGVKQKMQQNLPNARLSIIDDARHAVTMERPDVFNRTAMAFYEGLQERSTPKKNATASLPVA